MSTPISSFSKLSLTAQTSMQSSKAHHRSFSSGKGKVPASPHDDPSSPSDDEHDESPDSPIIEHIFALDHCRPHGMEEDDQHPSDPRYAFQIAEAQVERYSVRILQSSPNTPACTCGGTRPCRHVQWLLDQLARTNLSIERGPDPNLYQAIRQRGLENVCEDLHWELRDGSDSDPEDAEESNWQLEKKVSLSRASRQTRGIVRNRLNLVRDIMATLASEPTEDYRKDIFESPNDITDEEIVVPGDLGGTISRLLIRDEGAFFRSRNLVSHDLRATEYFKNMGFKAHKACELMDQYAQLGHSHGQIHHDVAWCGKTLIEIVNTLGRNIVARQQQKPLRSSSRQEAAKALVSILAEVVNRNKDVYRDDRLPRRRPHGEPQTDRNLYQRLIGSASSSNPAGPLFVLKELQDLPEAQPFVEDLEEILTKVKTIAWSAPQIFQEKLVAIITQLKGGVPPSSSSAEKRPATSGMERKAKRMK
jgi:hypothetical protein